MSARARTAPARLPTSSATIRNSSPLACRSPKTSDVAPSSPASALSDSALNALAPLSPARSHAANTRR